MATAYKGALLHSYGEPHLKVYVEEVTGPAEDTTIAAGGSADVAFAVNVPRDLVDVGVENVTGLPSGVYINAISFSGKNVTLTLVNTGGSDVTVAAGSITVKVVAIA